MSKYVMVVAELYQLGRGADGFTKDFKTKVRDKGIVPRSHVERINGQWENSGKWYEVFEDETKKRFKEGSKKVQEIKEAQASADELGKVMADTLKSVKKTNKPKAKNESNNEKESLLDKVEELTGERPHHLTGINKLHSMIEEASNN